MLNGQVVALQPDTGPILIREPDQAAFDIADQNIVRGNHPISLALRRTPLNNDMTLVTIATLGTRISHGGG